MTIDLRDREIIEQMTGVRMANNVLWMQIVEIALEHATDETRAVLRRIRENDRTVCDLNEKLAR